MFWVSKNQISMEKLDKIFNFAYGQGRGEGAPSPPLLRPAWLSKDRFLRLTCKASHKSVYEQLWYFVNLYPILFQIVKTVSHDIILQEWDPRRIYRVSISQCFCKTLHKYNKNETHFVSHTLLVTSLHCRWTSTTSHICLGRSSHLINQIRMCRGYFLQ